MFLSKGKLVWCLLLILMSISAFENGAVVEASSRSLKEKPTQIRGQGANASNGGNGFVATVNRAVPSCPDPLHNK
ncbi:hypothetical protein MANES_08G121500v8 [Manihot esculenta]|uniref:Uncharacterized protein n=1 Tax=Manihot esculenta TaxID=3983 RepID=A0A2C9VFQ0_MANES|nr:hypothetical protein MANES_08G121500v8 [Manihot esculenta]